MIVILLYIIGFGSLFINIFNTRNFILTNPDLYLETLVTNNKSVERIGQITVSLFLLACLLGIGIGLYYWKRNLPRRGGWVTIAGLFLYTPIILSSLVSGNGGFSYKLFFFPLFMITVYLSPHFNLYREIKKILPILLVYIYTSLIAIFLNPTWAYSNYLNSWVGIPIRLYGAASHPNGIGYLALSYLILVRLNRKKSVWYYVHAIAGVITLILSQSKTTWIALIIWIILELIIKKVSIRRQITSRMLSITLTVILIIVAFVLLFEKSFLGSFFNFDLSLTGRTNVWQITLDTWLKNPIFGYGPNLWNLGFRQQYNFLWAGHAHNQFLQTLGESGLVGVFGLLCYLLVFIYFSSRFVNVTNFASLGFFVITLVRSFTETPLSNYDLNTSFLIHAIIFVMLVHIEGLSKNLTEYTQINSTSEIRNKDLLSYE